MKPWPDDLAELTPEWLTEAINDGGLCEGIEDAEVTSLTVESLGAGTAFLGDLARLTVTYSDSNCSAPQRLIAKVPTNDPGGRSVGQMLNVWWREAMFYARLAPLVDAPVARCVFNGADPDNGRYLLILADLHPDAPGDQVAGATQDQAEAAVEALARFHAPWWGRPRSDEVAWVPGLDRPGTSDALQAAMMASFDRFVSRFGDTLPDEQLDWHRRFIPRLGQWRAGVAERPLTIAHADYRLENMLFSTDGTVTVLDWQTAMYTGGPTDLSFFLATNLPIELRRDTEAELVGLYVETLHRTGVDPSLTTTVREDYEHAHLWWMGMLGNNLSSIETPDERSAALFDAMLQRLYAAAGDADCGRFV